MGCIMVSLQEDLLFQKLKDLGELKKSPKNTCLYNLQIVDQYVYCLEEGVCALISITKNGEEKIYQYFKAGALIGFVPAYAPFYTDETFSAFSLVTKSNCTLYQIPYSTFCDFIASDSSLYPWVIQMVINHYDDVLTHFHNLQEGNNFSNLCRTLLELSVYQDGHYKMHKYFSYSELAKYLGIHTITVTRMMAKLKSEDVIYKEGHHTIIKNTKKLADYID